MNIFVSLLNQQQHHFIRMSLTLGAILSAKHIYVHFEGKEKIAVYEEAIGGEDIYTMPIRSSIKSRY